MAGRFTLISDPVHGFVTVEGAVMRSLVASAPFQRLRRIRQLGLGFLVFPGAVHTRFEHGLGAMALMQDALATLSAKGTPISSEEAEAAAMAALLHDVGHAPFSHTLEKTLIPPGPGTRPFHHERMSRALIQRLDSMHAGALQLALAIFDGTYERPFFHSLVASQLDMDRLDYLRRDSFYTGVAEGVIGVERILKTIRVFPEAGGPDSRVVVDEKGLDAVENYLLSRRLMFSQVYLHKTVVAADHLLISLFDRARAVLRRDSVLDGTAPSLAFFLAGAQTADVIDRPPDDAGLAAVLDRFVDLDDTDVLYSVKRWRESSDPILADLAGSFIERRLPRVVYVEQTPSEDELGALRERMAGLLVADGRSRSADATADARYYVGSGVSRLDAYRARGEGICLLGRDGKLRELSEASELLAMGAAAVERPYIVRPKEMDDDG